MFLDTETVSLNNLTLLEVAWILTNEAGYVIKERSLIISHMHNTYDLGNHPNKKRFTSKRVQVEGHKHENAMFELRDDIMQYENILVSHNVDFDKKVLEKNIGQTYRQDYTFCTMSDKRIVDFCAIPLTNGGWAEKQGYDFKPPKLSELHTKLFGKEHRSQHTALGDARAVKRCFFKLKKLGVI